VNTLTMTGPLYCEHAYHDGTTVLHARSGHPWLLHHHLLLLLM